MKVPGDVRIRPVVPTFGAMIVEMATALSAADDVRFKRFWTYRPVGKLAAWFQNQKTTNVIVGANKSTKSTVGVWKCIAIYTGLVPPQVRAIWPDAAKIPLSRPRHVRLIVQDYTKHWPETIKPLCMDETYGMMPKAWASNYDPDEHIFYGPDGSFLSIMAIDPKQVDEVRIATVLRGPLIDHTYIDEIQPRAVYTESLTRSASLRDGPRTVDLGFCPQEGYDWTWEDLYKAGYDPGTDEPLPDEFLHPDINVMRLSMRDNPSISTEAIDQYIRTLKPWEISYRVDGRYTARAGDPYFDLTALGQWERAGIFRAGTPWELKESHVDIEAGIFQGDFIQVSGRFDAEDRPIWRVWENPIEGEYYLMVLDTAEGHKNSDFQVCDIWRCSKDKKIDVNFPVQAAQLRIREMKPGDFVENCLCVADYWGEILVAYEVNNTSGGTVRDRSRNYPNLYKRTMGRREVEDDTELLGWYTDSVSKPAALEEAYHLLAGWNTETCGLRSSDTTKELMAFQEKIERDPKTGLAKRVFGPLSGMHDDCVMGLGIFSYILRNQKEMLTPSLISDRHMVNRTDILSTLEQKAHDLTKRNAPPLRKQPSLNLLARLYGRGSSHSTSRLNPKRKDG